MTREEHFNAAVAEFDNKTFSRAISFAEHRYVSIERDLVAPGARYVKGHATLRGACDHLARAVEGSEGFVPDGILDLDSGETIELTLFAFVAPVSLDPVAVMMPRAQAVVLRDLFDVIVGTSDDVVRVQIAERGCRLFNAALNRKAGA